MSYSITTICRPSDIYHTGGANCACGPFVGRLSGEEQPAGFKGGEKQEFERAVKEFNAFKWKPCHGHNAYSINFYEEKES